MAFLGIVSVAGTGRSLPFLFVGFSDGGLEEVFGEGIFWRAARLADTGASRSKQAAQLSPGAALPALCLWSRGPGICPWKCLVSWMGEGFWWSCP